MSTPIDETVGIATELMTRIGSPADVQARAEALGLDRISFDPEGLAGGFTGLALVMYALGSVTSEDRWFREARALTRAALESMSVDELGLYSGVGGVAFFVCEAASPESALVSEVRTAFETMIAGLIDTSGVRRLTHVKYELINGAAGLYVAAHRLGLEEHCDIIEAFFQSLLDSPDELRRLTGPPPSLNLGVSHGIAGIVGALATVGRGSAREICRDYCALLTASSIELGASGALWWPYLDSPDPHLSRPSRAAWCFGSPGIAAVLASAGQAFGLDGAMDTAVRAARDLRRVTRSAWQIKDFALCHGLAGVAVCIDTVARWSEDDEARDFATDLFDEVRAAFDPAKPLGYKSEFALQLIDDDGLLTGTAGIALALLSREPGFNRHNLHFLGLA